MKKIYSFVIAIFLITVLPTSCQKDPAPSSTPSPNPGTGNGNPNTDGNNKDDDKTNTDTDWSIPKDLVFDGGPGKDGIPSIDLPKFTLGQNVDYLNSEDLIIGIKINGEIRGYPHPILDWHEIVNDNISGIPFALTYCPLTGSAIAWNRKINGKITSFGVSGLLYNSNLIPYDRATDTNWSQMLLKGIGGELNNTEADLYPVIETTWSTWQKMFPNAKVLNTNTGANRNYTRYPYGSYRSDNQLYFPVRNDDGRLHKKDRGLGIIGNTRNKFYPLQSFSDGKKVINEELGDLKVVIIGDAQSNIIVGYNRELSDGTILEFLDVDSEISTDALITDQEGNLWNIFGEAISGPRKGTRLSSPKNYIGYWFAWATFYPDINIYNN